MARSVHAGNKWLGSLSGSRTGSTRDQPGQAQTADVYHCSACQLEWSVERWTALDCTWSWSSGASRDDQRSAVSDDLLFARTLSTAWCATSSNAGRCIAHLCEPSAASAVLPCYALLSAPLTASQHVSARRRLPWKASAVCVELCSFQC
jgi:hypothetical protein